MRLVVLESESGVPLATVNPEAIDKIMFKGDPVIKIHFHSGLSLVIDSDGSGDTISIHGLVNILNNRSKRNFVVAKVLVKGGRSRSEFSVAFGENDIECVKHYTGEIFLKDGTMYKLCEQDIDRFLSSISRSNSFRSL